MVTKYIYEVYIYYENYIISFNYARRAKSEVFTEWIKQNLAWDKDLRKKYKW